MTQATAAVGEIIQTIIAAVTRSDWLALASHLHRLQAALGAGAGLAPGSESDSLLDALLDANRLGAFDAVAPDTTQVVALLENIIEAGKPETYNLAQLRKSTANLIEQLTGPDARVPHRPETLGPTASSRGMVESALSAMRDAGEFDLLARLTDTLISRGDGTPAVRTYLAQALMELGKPSSAIAVLRELLISPGLARAQRVKANGLLGRAYSSIYLALSGDPGPRQRPVTIRRALQASIRYYLANYDSATLRTDESSRWSGLRLAAMLHVAQYDGVAPPVGAVQTSREVGAEIAAALDPQAWTWPEKLKLDPWIYATLAEAYLAAGQIEPAIDYLGKLAQHPKTTAYVLADIIRSLERRRDARGDQPKLGFVLKALRTKLGDLVGASIDFDLDDAGQDDGSLELTTTERATPAEGRQILQSILGSSAGPMRIDWLDNGRRAARAVGRIFHVRDQDTRGTGFLIKGSDLDSRLGERLYLLTNHHVVCTRQLPHSKALLEEDARVIFDDERRRDQRAFGCHVVWISPERELDATLVRLTGEDVGQRLARLRHLSLARELPSLQRRAYNNAGMRPSLAYVIGHTKGQEKYISAKNNEILARGPRETDTNRDFEYLHYRAPTAGGNSGSPVFEEDEWLVIALHHAGSVERTLVEATSSYQTFPVVNEGISIVSIRKAIRAAPMLHNLD